MKKGDLVRVLVEYPPGIEDLVRENEREIFACYNRLGVVLDSNPIEDTSVAVRVRLEGNRYESTGWWFTDDMLELLATDPLEEN